MRILCGTHSRELNSKIKVNAKTTETKFLIAQLHAYYIFHIIFIFYSTLYNKYVDKQFFIVHSSILISLKDLANSYQQFKTGRKNRFKKGFFEKNRSKDGSQHFLFHCAGFIRLCQQWVLGTNRRNGHTLCFKEVFGGIHSSFLVVC